MPQGAWALAGLALVFILLTGGTPKPQPVAGPPSSSSGPPCGCQPPSKGY